MIDFLTLPNPGEPGNDLRGYDALYRHDLATLRQCARAKGGVEHGNIGNLASSMRLIRAGLIVKVLDAAGSRFLYVTALGRETVRVNASCIDGSEGLPLPYRRRLA